MVTSAEGQSRKSGVERKARSGSNIGNLKTTKTKDCSSFLRVINGGDDDNLVDLCLRNRVSFPTFFPLSAQTRSLGPYGFCLISTSMTGTQYSPFDKSRYAVFITTALALKPHNLQTSERCMGAPEINPTHNWGNK